MNRHAIFNPELQTRQISARWQEQLLVWKAVMDVSASRQKVGVRKAPTTLCCLHHLRSTRLSHQSPPSDDNECPDSSVSKLCMSEPTELVGC